MSSIPNSLSRSFPRISLEQGRIRAGLQPGWSSAEHAAGKTMRDRFSFQMWGTNAEGSRVGNEDSFLSGDVFRDLPGAPLDNGWRRDFSLGLVDRDPNQNLTVTVERGSESQAELVISNQGEQGAGSLRIALDFSGRPTHRTRRSRYSRRLRSKRCQRPDRSAPYPSGSGRLGARCYLVRDLGRSLAPSERDDILNR